MGDGVLTGCNCVLHPGTIVGAGTQIYQEVLLRPLLRDTTAVDLTPLVRAELGIPDAPPETPAGEGPTPAPIEQPAGEQPAAELPAGEPGGN